MSDVAQRIAKLSPQKRSLLMQQLQQEGLGRSDELPIHPRARTGELALSFAQQRLWFLDQLEPGSPMYNIPAALRMTGQLDVAALQQSLQEIVRRHEALRTTFAAVEGRPVQRIAPALAFQLPVVDLRHLPTAERESEALRLAGEEARRSFDLFRGPLLRACLLRLGDDDHLMLLTMHHSISDGWSCGVLLREMALLYRAFIAGHPSPLPELPLQYADFALWQRERLQGKALDEQLSFWRRHLAGSPPLLHLPTDRPRPVMQSTRGALQEFVLPQDLFEALKNLYQREGVTLFMALLAAFQTLLYRLTSQQDFTVGTPIANRNRAEIEGLVGFFVNTLVLRADLSGHPDFRQLLQRVRQATLEAFAHQDVPFDMLVDELQPERDTSYTPLFQVMFALQNPLPVAGQLGHLVQRLVPVHNGTAKFDLTLVVTEGPCGLSGELEYNVDLYDAATVARILGYWQVLLEGIVAYPDQSITTLPLLSKAQRRQLLVEWNATRLEYSPDRCVHQLFEVQAGRSPDAIAATWYHEALTYRELNRRANQLAYHLRKLGMGPETLVAICMSRSLDLIVSALGIFKAGSAYMPLDPQYPQERLAFMLKDAQTPVLLTQKQLLPELPATQARIICLDADGTFFAQESRENSVSRVAVGNLAYVIYTSGSTGRPKGVLVEHEGLLNLVTWTQRTFSMSPADRGALVAGPGFDASVWELWSFLSVGASVHIPGEETHATPVHLRDWLVAGSITVTFAPTPLAESMLALSWPREAALRLLHTGGDQLHYHPPSRLAFGLINNYGPTEYTVITASGLVPPRERDDRAPLIGRPVANSQVYIVDAHMQPVPIGVPGELLVGGIGLARGYLNRPEWTAERFIPNPFSAEAGRYSFGKGDLLYRTGDLVRYQPDGAIEFLGRMDYQVKIRGFRIELGEIEAVVRQYPAVREAIVLAWEDQGADFGSARERPGLGKRLVAYIVPQQNLAPAAGELRAWLKEKLPDYMIPTAFVMLEALPLTTSGKVDRRALPAPSLIRPEAEAARLAPRTPEEEIVAGVWAEALGVERVSIHDDFFDLGGHSLLATQVISRLQDAFHVELQLRRMFETPTVDGVASMIVEARRATQGLAATPIHPAPRDGELVLSFAQQRLWFLEQLLPGTPLYNVPSAVRLTGRLDIAVLERCLNEIVRRHQVLRTTFPAVAGKPVLNISAHLAVSLPVVDLTGLPQAERAAQALHQATIEARRPFDLACGPLLRAILLRLDGQDHLILLMMHHIVSDGWSAGVLIREVAALYRAFVDGQPSPLAELPIQYADFAQWQRQWLQGAVLASQLDYWKQQLGGELPVLELPADRPYSAVESNQGALFSFALPAGLSSALQALSRQAGATIFMTLLAAFQVLLYRCTGQDDISVGTPIANRNRVETKDLVGFFVNTLVMRTDLSGDPSFREVVARVREVALGAYVHQDLPFEHLVDALQPERSLAHNPLFQVMFTLQNVPMQMMELPGLEMSLLQIDAGVATFDLTLMMTEKPEGLAGVWEYNTDLFDQATIGRLTEHFYALLESIVADPGRSISTLAILPEDERRQLLVEWNDTMCEYPRDRCVHQLIEDQVQRSPEAIALVSEGEQLTYAELNRRANQLAHHLRKTGVRPETLVGLCAERSPELMVGLLGIHKAGGAFVPLDPGYPAERLAFMMQDARLRVLLTQARSWASLPAHPAQVICLDADWEVVAQCGRENPDSEVSPDNLAYVIYTSGSTGKPKGVQVTHRSAVNHNQAVLREFGLEPSDRVLQFATINFDTAVEEIFPTWMSGAQLVLRPDGMLTGAELERIVESEGLTVLDLPTAYWHEWVYERSLLARPLPAGLRCVVVGGEKAEVLRYATWQKVGGARIAWMNSYGPTEGTVIATLYEPAPGEQIGAELPIGRPIANAQVYVLDRRLQLAPIGVPGELYIGGVGVARGYLNRPDLTGETFIPDPFSKEPKARLYRTGDQARWRPDGNLEFLGRADHQVKIRGFRIELGEIEAALKQHVSLREAVIVARTAGQGRKHLVAYVVPASGAVPDAGELGGYLRDTLPDYMLPSAYVILETLPLLPSGKVNRRALPAPEQAYTDTGKYVAPQTAAEETLAGIWAQTLGIKQVGMHDNFFELGGDSILSIQVIARANQAGLRLTPKQLFEHPTVAELAAVAGTVQAAKAHCEQGIVQGLVPLTPIQCWFLEHAVHLPEPHHWNQAFLLEVDRTFDAAQLPSALEHLLAHHDALRLRFVRSPSGWRQINAGTDVRVPFESIDLSGLQEVEQRLAIESHTAALQASLELAMGPLLCAAYFDLGQGRPGRLFIVIHHLVVDGVSWRILLQDLLSAYQQLCRGEQVRLPPKTTSFQAWAQHLSDYARSEAVRNELLYWAAVPKGLRTGLPLDHCGGENAEASARTVTISLSPDETRGLLQDVPAAYGTEINDALLTALAQVMARWTRVRAVLVELEGHGREDLFEDVDLSRTVGWFTTTFPVRLDLAGIEQPGEALKAVKEQLRQIPKRGIGYGLLRYLSCDPDVVQQLAALPQPSVTFNYLGQFDQTLGEFGLIRPARESTGPSRGLKGMRSHVLDIYGGIVDGRLQLEWTYSENLHRRATIERLAQEFVLALQALIAHCQLPDTVAYTPSDFLDVELEQDEIQALMEEVYQS